MKSLLLAGAMIVAAGTSAFAQMAIGWSATARPANAMIVTSNPVINAQVGGNISSAADPTDRSTMPNSHARPSALARR